MLSPTPTNSIQSSIFSAPWWTPLSIIVTLAVGIPALILAWKALKRKSISYQILTDEQVTYVKAGVEKDIKIYYQDKPVNNVRLVIIKIWNSGNMPIVEKDYYEQLTFIKSEKVSHSHELSLLKTLYAQTIKTEPENSQIRAVWVIRLRRWGLNKILLNPKDSVTVKLLIADYKGRISVEGRIIGGTIKQVENDYRNLVPLLVITDILGLFIMGFFLYSIQLFSKTSQELIPNSPFFYIFGYILVFLFIIVFIFTTLGIFSSSIRRFIINALTEKKLIEVTEIVSEN